MESKSISQLPTAEETTSSDLFETAVPSGSGYSSRKVSLDQMANLVVNTNEYQSLSTTEKTIIGAINELYSMLTEETT